MRLNPVFFVTGRLLGLLVLVSWLGACNYSVGTKHLYDPQYRSINVPIFENRTLTRGVQHALTEALVKEIGTRTPYVLGGPGASDTVLQGVVTEVRRNLTSRSSVGNVPEQLELSVSVDFEWRDLRTGQVIKGRQGYVATGTYIPRAPIFETEDVAIQTAVTRLAEDIVMAMQSDWVPGEDAG